MARRRFHADVPDGTHLGVSHENNGAYRGHLFDDETNKLVGHVELEEDEEYDEYDDDDEVAEKEEETTWADVLAPWVFLGVMVGAAKGAEYLRDRRQQSLDRSPEPVPESLRSRARRLWKQPAAQARTAEIAVAPAEDTISMSSAEWQERVRAMLLARAFSDEQQRILSHARIVDADPEMLEWQRAFDSLTPQQFSERITLMLEANPALLTEAEARFLALFGPGRTPERERVPAQATPARALPAASRATPAGWYDDGRGAMRWWSGQGWTAHVQPSQRQAAAGWYDDGPDRLRWWDGRQWTGHVAPVQGTRPR